MQFSYDKSTIQMFERQMKIRQKALPVLQGKEAALRKAIFQQQTLLETLEKELHELRFTLLKQAGIWLEWPSILRIKHIHFGTKITAGVKLKTLEEVEFEEYETDWIYGPIWLFQGVKRLKDLVELSLKVGLAHEQLLSLEFARKKTTQKVNLYEKVQIPFYEISVRKIKRFLEDKENIATAAKKIAKMRQNLDWS